MAAVRRGATVIRVHAVDKVLWRLLFQKIMLEELHKMLNEDANNSFKLHFTYECVHIDAANGRTLLTQWARSLGVKTSTAYISVHISPPCTCASGVHQNC